MSEQQGGQPPEEGKPGFTRRQVLALLGGLTKVGAGAALIRGATALGQTLETDQKDLEKGLVIKTKSGEFYPLYPLKEKTFPEVDAYVDFGRGVPEGVGPEIPVAKAEPLPDTSNIFWTQMAAAMIGPAISVPLLAYAAGSSSESKTESGPSRRAFLKEFSYKALAALGAIYGLNRLNILIPIVAAPSHREPFTVNEVALSRVSDRIFRITAAANPEQYWLLYLDALRANQLLTLAKHLGREKTTPKIAYSPGLTMTGIEDFLRAGQDACRGTLTSYPPPFNRALLKEKGMDSITSLTLTHPDGGTEKITDQKLRESLEGQIS